MHSNILTLHTKRERSGEKKRDREERKREERRDGQIKNNNPEQMVGSIYPTKTF